MLRHVVDNANSGFVTPAKFSEFLGLFGPLEKCLDNVCSPSD